MLPVQIRRSIVGARSSVTGSERPIHYARLPIHRATQKPQSIEKQHRVTGDRKSTDLRRHSCPGRPVSSALRHPEDWLRFRWVKAPTSAELARLTQILALCIGRYLERQGPLERDAENSYLAGDALEAGPMEQLVGSSISYRIAIRPQQGRKVFSLQTLPACDEPVDDGVRKVAGFSLPPAHGQARLSRSPS